MAELPAPERALQQLQHELRRSVDGEPTVMTRRIPEPYASENAQTLLLSDRHTDAVAVAFLALDADLRFEHLGDGIEKIVWDFVLRVEFEAGDQVPAFVAANAREPLTERCFLPVEHLILSEPLTVHGLLLVPTNHTDLPTDVLHASWLDPPAGSVAVVEVTGTNLGRMAERARAEASRVLRLLRLSLAACGLGREQRRFRLSEKYAFAVGASGWQRHADGAYDAELNAEIVETVNGYPFGELAESPTTDVTRQAHLALKWLERSTFAVEPVPAMLFLFFAAEALLGKKSERLKGPGIAFRQAMLGSLAGEGFVHPTKMLVLYDKVRSAAVHGEEVEGVNWDAVTSFEREVRVTLRLYVCYCHDNGIVKRGRLLNALDESEQQADLITWIRANGGPGWHDFLAQNDS